MENEKYYLGLDMGTNSVGWAVTNPNYELIRRKGKDLWGVREFERADTAKKRRGYRISRRAHQREIIRIGYLKDYFADEISKVDPDFFQRLENSKYFLEDKDEEVRTKNGIFNDKDYDDKAYYKQYPTIYHLRKELMDNSEEHDARLVYLALLNMYKHRGHFLNETSGDDEHGISDEILYSQFVEQAGDVMYISFPDGVVSQIMDVLSSRKISRKEKCKKIKEICGIETSDKKNVECVKAICGLKFNINTLFGLEEKEQKNLCFADISYDENAANYEEELDSEKYRVIECMKQLYDRGQLSGLLKGHKSLTHARVSEYNKHHDDLVLLKKVYRKLPIEKYNEMFREDIANSYSAYVNSVNSSNDSKNGKPCRRSFGGRTRDDLYKKIKTDLKDVEANEDVTYILQEISNETFLPKQLTAGNGIIPNKVFKSEMKKILDNASKYLEFLNEVDESELTIAERILEIFSFHIPYYVGPVSENSAKYGGNGWSVRKEDGPVMPWNIEDKIDMGRTQEEFISRLVRECTYISGEKVLPKNSLIYERFRVLNEINNIRINGDKISVELKQDIYNEKFMTGKRVTRKQLLNYINGRLSEQISDSQLTGVDATIANSLSSYGKFYAIFGEDMKKDSYQEMCEEIIYISTIYGDSRKRLQERINQINEKYDHAISEADVKRILGYKFKDWGNLSKEFFELQGCNPETGEVVSLNKAMWETNYNLMELINDEQFMFADALKEKKKKITKCLKEFKATDLDEYYFSAPVKRMIWQTLLIIKEIEGVMKCAPEKIFIEMTRTEEEKGDKGRKDSRQKQLEELYNNIRDEDKEWIDQIKIEGIKENTDSGDIRRKKIYLYYLQMGRCMYTGNPIDLQELLSNANNKYDIDHIYPRHFVKDDNIMNNLVLVEKETNAYKSDNYPVAIDNDKKERVHVLWNALHINKFISDEKYKRLTSRKEFTEEEKAGFIALQLVETSQGTKGVAELLKALLPEPETRIVYAKGRNVTDFRNMHTLLKSRTVNDFHHAKDAYLNIVVGNVYDTKFTQNPLNFIRKEYMMDMKKNNYHLGNMYRYKVERNGEVAWVPSESDKTETGTIATVRKVMEKNTPLLTRMNFEVTGAISDDNPIPASKSKIGMQMPLSANDEKLQDIEKYGSLNSIKGAYFFLVEHLVKKKIKRTLEILPIYVAKTVHNDDDLISYCVETLGFVNPRICISKINYQSLYEIDGYRVHITGKGSGGRVNLRNATSMKMSQKWINYIHDIEKYVIQEKIKKTVSSEKNIELYDVITDKHNKSIFEKRPNGLGEKLSSGREFFVRLECENQMKVLLEIIKTTEIGSGIGNLTLIGGSKGAGEMKYSKNVLAAQSFRLINQSVTGIYESSIDLQKI